MEGKKRILVARLSKGSMLQARDSKIAELNNDPEQQLISYSDSMVESADTIYYYAVVTVDLNITAFAGFEFIDARPVTEKVEKELAFINKLKEVSIKVVDGRNEEAPVETPKTVSGTEIDGKYSGKVLGVDVGQTNGNKTVVVEGEKKEDGSVEITNISETENKPSEMSEEPVQDNAPESSESSPDGPELNENADSEGISNSSISGSTEANKA